MHFTVLEPSTDDRENVLVVTDVFTKFTQAFPTRDQKADTTAKILFREWFMKYGVPERLHSDQGRNFKSDVNVEVCETYGFKKTCTTPHHTDGNAQCSKPSPTSNPRKETKKDCPLSVTPTTTLQSKNVLMTLRRYKI